MISTSHIKIPDLKHPARVDPSAIRIVNADEGGKEGKEESPPAREPASPPLPEPAPESVMPPPSPEPIAATVISFASQGDDVFTPAPAINPVVASLQAIGLYQNLTKPGQHLMTCPWDSEHESEGKDTIYFEPTDNHPVGRFRCSHTHQGSYHLSDLLGHLGISEQEARCQPKVTIQIGELSRIVLAVEKVLAQSGAYFRTGNTIVAIKTDPASGDVSVEPLNEQAMMMALSRSIYWEKYDGRAKEVIRCEPTDRIVRTLLRAEACTLLPALNGLARQPFFRKTDRQLVMRPGYDPMSKIYASFQAGDFALPEPTLENAKVALNELIELLGEFHFDAAIDRSAALSAILTATVRSSLRLAPAFNISASSPGSGKSYLASVIAPFAGPGSPSNVSYPTTAEEATKAMQSILIGQPAVVIFDDMQTDWAPHGAINRALTSETITDRVLGSSRTATVSTATFFMGTGNNVAPVRDMCRRVITIYLNARHDSPATLSYQRRPAEAVRKERGSYVSSALTIIRAWQAAGCPRSDVTNIATYGDDWSDLCRQPLLWLGEPDPATSLIEQLKIDPDSEALGVLLAEWRAMFKDQPVTVRKLIQRADSDEELKDALFDLPVVERGEINRGKLGWYFKKSQKRTVGGLQLQKADSSERNSWKVVKVGDPTRPAVAPPLPTSRDAFVRNT